MIEGMAPVDTTRRTLIGHSLAGYFALDVLAHDRAAFRSYVAVSPSIWWNEPRLRAGLSGLRPVAARLAVFVGQWEQELAPWQQGRPDSAELAARRPRRGMVDRARSFVEKAAEVLGPASETCFHVLPEEDHASVLPAAMGRALRFALRPR